MQRFLKKSRGFTLIELLLVIAIIGVLATVVYVNINPAGNLADSRNARRVSDIATIDSAIQRYEANQDPTSAPANLQALVPSYLGVVPVDPSTNTAYTYCKGTTNVSSYGIGATLETGGSATKLTAIMATSSAAANLPAGCTSATLVGAGTCGTSPYYCRALGN